MSREKENERERSTEISGCLHFSWLNDLADDEGDCVRLTKPDDTNQQSCLLITVIGESVEMIKRAHNRASGFLIQWS